MMAVVANFSLANNDSYVGDLDLPVAVAVAV